MYAERRWPFWLASWLWELISPTRCVGCDAPTSGAFCPTCAERLDQSGCEGSSVEGCRVVTVGTYAPPLSDAIRAFKYRDRPDLARPLAELVLDQLRRIDLALPDVLVPVPLHPRRLAERGYNQSALLARRLGSGLGVKAVATALARQRFTPQLAGQTRAARMAQAENAFVVRHPDSIEGRNTMLVDDVLTTGATAAACVRALRAAGARTSAVVAIARAGSDRDLS